MTIHSRSSRLGYSLLDDLWQRLHQLYRLHAHRYHPTHQPHDVLLVVGTVGIAGDTAALVGAGLVLVDDPLQRRAVAQAVLEALRWDAHESQRLVDLELGLVL